LTTTETAILKALKKIVAMERIVGSRNGIERKRNYQVKGHNFVTLPGTIKSDGSGGGQQLQKKNVNPWRQDVGGDCLGKGNAKEERDRKILTLVDTDEKRGKTNVLSKIQATQRLIGEVGNNPLQMGGPLCI